MSISWLLDAWIDLKMRERNGHFFFQSLSWPSSSLSRRLFDSRDRSRFHSLELNCCFIMGCFCFGLSKHQRRSQRALVSPSNHQVTSMFLAAIFFFFLFSPTFWTLPWAFAFNPYNGRTFSPKSCCRFNRELPEPLSQLDPLRKQMRNCPLRLRVDRSKLFFVLRGNLSPFEVLELLFPKLVSAFSESLLSSFFFFWWSPFAVSVQMRSYQWRN